MLPEVIGKWCTRRPVADTTNVVPMTLSTQAEEPLDCEEEDVTRLWCYCHEPSFGDMILCDNEECPIKWFHPTDKMSPQKIIDIVCPAKGCRNLQKVKAEEPQKRHSCQSKILTLTNN